LGEPVLTNYQREILIHAIALAGENQMHGVQLLKAARPTDLFAHNFNSAA